MYLKVGFDSGNGKDFYAIPESRKADVINMTDKTNVGVPGVMIFKLSNANSGIVLPGLHLYLHYHHFI